MADIQIRHFLFYNSLDNNVTILDGAIVGTYEDDAMFDRLAEYLKPLGVSVIKPKII